MAFLVRHCSSIKTCNHTSTFFILLVFLVSLSFLYNKNITSDVVRKLRLSSSKILLQTKSLIPVKQNSSLICDNSTFARDWSNFIALYPYCSIVPTPRRKWIESQRYAEHDVVFVIFTGAKFYRTRAQAVRDTWLSRVTHYYFLGATSNSNLPVTVVEGAGEDRLSNMKKLFYGLQIVYKQQMLKSKDQRQKWFYIAGCDTFVNVKHILKRLDPYDATNPLLIGGHTGVDRCTDTTKGTSHLVTFPSGGAGFFFSTALLELMQPHLTHFLENVWPKGSEASDVALTCLALRIGVNLTYVPGFWAFPPNSTIQLDGYTNFHRDPEPNTYHYVTPQEMYLLDEFYLHQYLDRLENDENWDELKKFTRRFISSHFKLLKVKNHEFASAVV